MFTKDRSMQIWKFEDAPRRYRKLFLAQSTLPAYIICYPSIWSDELSTFWTQVVTVHPDWQFEKYQNSFGKVLAILTRNKEGGELPQ